MLIPERLKPLIRRLLRARLPDWRLIHLLYGSLYRASYVCYGLLMVLRKVFWVDPMVRAISAETGDDLQLEHVPYILGQGEIRLGNGVYISGIITVMFNHKLGLGPELSVGDRTFIGSLCKFTIARRIRIGRFCRIAGGCRFYDNSGHPLSLAERRRNAPVNPEDTKEVLIEDDVWIGAGSTILPGVTIGRGSIVGASSVVTRDIPPYTIVAGNPARPIRELTEAERAPPSEEPMP